MKKERNETLKETVVRSLVRGVRAGQYTPGSLLPSERELCDMFGVSRITVRAAIAEMVHGGWVDRYPRRGTVVRDREASEQAGGPGAGRKIVFLRWAASPSTSDHLAGVNRFCQEQRLEVVILDAQRSHEKQLGYLRQPPGDTGGVLVFPYDLPEYADAIRELLEQHVRVVCCGRLLEGVNVSTVVNDEFTGGYLATGHLIDQWHKPVYFLGMLDHPYSARERCRGWRAAMTEHGFKAEDKYFREIPISEEALVVRDVHEHWDVGYEVAKGLFNDRSTGTDSTWSVLAVNDHFARGVYLAAEQEGLVVGRDVFVAGHGDIPLATRLYPPLTSIAGGRQELGYAGAKLLYDLMTNPSTEVTHQVIPVQLVARASSLGVAKS